MSDFIFDSNDIDCLFKVVSKRYNSVSQQLSNKFKINDDEKDPFTNGIISRDPARKNTHSSDSEEHIILQNIDNDLDGDLMRVSSNIKLLNESRKRKFKGLSDLPKSRPRDGFFDTSNDNKDMPHHRQYHHEKQIMELFKDKSDIPIQMDIQSTGLNMKLPCLNKHDIIQRTPACTTGSNIYTQNGTCNKNSRQKKEIHNKVEKRRRQYINDKISELQNLLPDDNDRSASLRKGLVLSKSVEYIEKLKRDHDVLNTFAVQIQRIDIQIINLTMRIERLEEFIKQENADNNIYKRMKRPSKSVTDELSTEAKDICDVKKTSKDNMPAHTYSEFGNLDNLSAELSIDPLTSQTNQFDINQLSCYL